MNPRSYSRRGASVAVAGALLCLLILVVPLAGEQAKPKANPAARPYALIFGTVFEPDGRLAYGVKVRVRRADQKKTLQEAMSDHAGEFAFRVAAGQADYLVWADVPPPQKRDKSQADKHLPVSAPGQPAGLEIRVHIENEERVDISLHLTE